MPIKSAAMLVLAAALLAACSTPKTDAKHTESAQRPAQTTQVLYFSGPYDLTLTLTSDDGFKTAVLSDNSDARYHLTQAVAASGVRLENADGVFIHFKQPQGQTLNEGRVSLVPGKEIPIQEYRVIREFLSAD